MYWDYDKRKACSSLCHNILVPSSCQMFTQTAISRTEKENEGEYRSRIGLVLSSSCTFCMHVCMYMYVLCIFELLIPGYTSLSLSEAAAKSNKQLQYLNKTSKNILTYVSTYWLNVTCYLHSCPTYIHI